MTITWSNKRTASKAEKDEHLQAASEGKLVVGERLHAGPVDADNAVSDFFRKGDRGHSEEIVIGKTSRVIQEVVLVATEDIAETEPWEGSIAADPSSPAARLRRYKDFVSRTVEVFGDDLTASRWLSMPSSALQGKAPLEVAQKLDFQQPDLGRVFEPIFIRIEHGIYL